MQPIKANQSNNPDAPTVAHLVHQYYELTANWIRTQIQYLSRYNPIVLTEKTANLEDHSPPEYCALKEYPLVQRWMNWASHRIVGYPISFSRMICEKKPQLLHAHFGFNGYEALPLAKRTKLPLITTFYGVDASKLPQKYPIWRKYYSKLFQYGSRFLVEGNHMGRQLMSLGCPEDKITVQHLGIELARLPYAPRRLVSGQCLKILAVGRFIEKKGLCDAIEAFAKLRRQGVNCKLTIIGDAAANGDPGYVQESQATKQQILDAIKKSGVADKVTRLGVQPYDVLIKAYYDHHIFFSPSIQAKSGDNEGGAPVTLIEAGASGMPVVATRHCDIPEVVQDGATGLLAAEGDTEVFADCILTFVNNPQRLVDMGAAAHGHIASHYSAKKQGERLETIYDSVINSTWLD